MNEFNFEHEKEMKIRFEIIEGLLENKLLPNDHKAIDKYLLCKTPYSHQFTLIILPPPVSKNLSQAGV